MADIWTVVREPHGDESPFAGPFTSREEAEEWADEQKREGRKIHDIRRLDFPVGPSGPFWSQETINETRGELVDPPGADSVPGMTDPTVAEHAAIAEANLPTTLKLASDAEAQAREWLTHLQAHPPANEAERQHYRDKAAEFRTFHAERLQIMRESMRGVDDLLGLIDTAPEGDQVLILGKHICSILEGEASTARALADVLEVCVAIGRFDSE